MILREASLFRNVHPSLWFVRSALDMISISTVERQGIIIDVNGPFIMQVMSKDLERKLKIKYAKALERFLGCDFKVTLHGRFAESDYLRTLPEVIEIEYIGGGNGV